MEVVDKEKKKKYGSKMRKDAAEYAEKVAKRGVMYISRVPPFMKPNKVRSLLEPYGEITRLYLAEEDAEVRHRRKMAGGNGSKQFAEGWVEFADKKIAKQVALSLNGQTIGSKKGDFYHDDLWNVKYLKNFKWDYLTEKFAYERRVRENKLKATMMQAKRQNAEFKELVEQNKAYEHIQERKRKRGEDNGEETQKKRQFRHVQAIDTDGTTVGSDVIESVFTKKSKKDKK